jgi:hypothetical protein
MLSSRTSRLNHTRASALDRFLVFTLVAGLLTSGCAAPDDLEAPGGGPAADSETKTAALATDGLHGFMIVNSGNPGLAVNAYGGAYDGGPLKLYQGCWWENGACTWTYRNGMLFSDHDPKIAIKSSDNPVDGEALVQSARCMPRIGVAPTSCKWIYKDGRFISAANPNLAIYARGKHGADLVLDSGCVTSSSANCRFVIQRAMIGNANSGDGLMFNAWGGASQASPVRLADACTRDNHACTWTFRDGMILSDDGLALNAYGGATSGAQIVMAQNCDVSNPACRWRLENGAIYSDTSNLRISPASLTNGANLYLGTSCTSNTCAIDMPIGGAQCGEMDQAPCDGKCAQWLTPVGGKCAPFFSTTIRCPGSGSLEAGTVSGSLTVGFTNKGDWAFRGHAHDGGPVGLNYTLGFTFNKSIDGKKIGAVHSGVVHGTFDFGSRNDDFIVNGFDRRLIDNWPALFSGGITCRMKSTTNGWLLAEDALIGLGLATATAVGLLLIVRDAQNSPDDGCHWEEYTADSIHRVCP